MDTDKIDIRGLPADLPNGDIQKLPFTSWEKSVFIGVHPWLKFFSTAPCYWRRGPVWRFRKNTDTRKPLDQKILAKSNLILLKQSGTIPNKRLSWLNVIVLRMPPTRTFFCIPAW